MGTTPSALALLTALVCLSTGCASIKSPGGLLPSRTTTPQRVAVNSKKKLTDEELQAAIARIDAERDEAQCDQALAAWSRGHSDEARRILDELLSRRPKHITARRLLADLLLENGDEQRAKQLLEDVLRDDPSNEAAKTSLRLLQSGE